jgi:hypothetical protein
MKAIKSRAQAGDPKPLRDRSTPKAIRMESDGGGQDLDG